MFTGISNKVVLGAQWQWARCVDLTWENDSPAGARPPLQEATPELQAAHYSRLARLSRLDVFPPSSPYRTANLLFPSPIKTWNRQVKWHQPNHSIRPSGHS